MKTIQKRSWSWWRYLHFLTSIAKCLPHSLRIFKNKGQNRYLKSLNEISLTFFYSVMRGFQYLIGEKKAIFYDFCRKFLFSKSFMCYLNEIHLEDKLKFLKYLFIENEKNFMIYSVRITAIFNLHFRIPIKWYLLQKLCCGNKNNQYICIWPTLWTTNCVQFITENAKVVDVIFKIIKIGLIAKTQNTNEHLCFPTSNLNTMNILDVKTLKMESSLLLR